MFDDCSKSSKSPGVRSYQSINRLHVKREGKQKINKDKADCRRTVRSYMKLDIERRKVDIY